MKINKFFLILVLFAGCSKTFEESAKIDSLKVEPEYIEKYTIVVDDYSYGPYYDFWEGEFRVGRHKVGSHEEERERLIPEKYCLNFTCPHGSFEVRSETEDFPIIRGGLKIGKYYKINFRKGVFGVSHSEVFEDLNRFKRVLAEDKK